MAEAQPSATVRLARWAAVLLWMGIIFVFSDQPYSGQLTEGFLGGWNIPVRKLAHLTEYAVLYLLTRWALTPTAGPSQGSGDRMSAKGIGLSALALAGAYAAIDEWHQSFVPGRSATISDVAVDIAGAFTGLLLWWMATELIRRSRP